MTQLHILQLYINKQKDGYYDKANITVSTDNGKVSDKVNNFLNLINNFCFDKHNKLLFHSATNSEPFIANYSNKTIVNNLLTEPNSGTEINAQNSETWIVKHNDRTYRIDLIHDMINLSDNNQLQLDNSDIACYFLLDYRTKAFNIYSDAKLANSEFTSDNKLRYFVTNIFDYRKHIIDNSIFKGIPNNYISAYKIRKKIPESNTKVAKCLIEIR